MGRNGSRHADRDALRAVGQQVWERRRQNNRLLREPIVVGAEVDQLFVQPVEQQPRDFGQAGFGVAVGGSVIAVDVAEIALPVDQRIAGGKILREPHQRVVNRLVAVRVEITHHVADDFRRLLERRPGIQPQQAHAVEDAAVDRLEPVARVRQCPVHDRGQRICEVALFQSLSQCDVLRLALRRGNQLFAHDASIQPAVGRNNSLGVALWHFVGICTNTPCPGFDECCVSGHAMRTAQSRE